MTTENVVNLKIKTVENLTINQVGGASTVTGLDEVYTLGGVPYRRGYHRSLNMSYAQEDALFQLHMHGVSIRDIAKNEARAYSTVQNAIGRAATRECFRARERAKNVEPFLAEEYTDDHADEQVENQALVDCQAKVRNLEALVNALSEE